MIAGLAEGAHQCLTGRGGTVPCGAFGFWVTTILAWAFGIIGMLVILVTIWQACTRNRGRRRR